LALSFDIDRLAFLSFLQKAGGGAISRFGQQVMVH
jgi:hypothetical protein